MLDLYRKHRTLTFVSADEVFQRVLEQGPPGRHPTSHLDHA
jgi:hypothetical protein